jgi:hypothetical protein
MDDGRSERSSEVMQEIIVTLCLLSNGLTFEYFIRPYKIIDRQVYGVFFYFKLRHNGISKIPE